jgi:hypothetical protein
MKNHLYEFPIAISQVNGSPHPEFDFIIQTEPSLLRVMADEEGNIVQNDYVSIFYPEKITGVCVDSKMMIAMAGREPAGSHIMKGLLCEMFSHYAMPLVE